MSAISSSRDIILNCNGTLVLNGGSGIDNEFYTYIDGDPAICAQDNALILNGTGTLKLYGGKGGNTFGEDFYNNSTAGHGGTAVEVDAFVVNVSRLYVYGGAGGNGGTGIQGANGVDGVSDGASGTDGGNGGYGCGGGNGGMGLWVLGGDFDVYTSNIYIYGGHGGNGGTGGRGGDGGDGADGSKYGDGGDGGDAGDGGVGGDYGLGVIAVDDYAMAKIKFYNAAGNVTTLPSNLKTMFETWAANGTPGAGGNPGTPGTGGAGGSGFLGIGAGADGQNGTPGEVGSPGGNPGSGFHPMNTTSIQSDNSIIGKNSVLMNYIVRRIGPERAYELYGISWR